MPFPAGKLIRSNESSRCTDVASDATGFVFAAGLTTESNSLTIFSTKGRIIHTIQLDHPCGVAKATDGSVYRWQFGVHAHKLWKLRYVYAFLS